MFWYEKNTIAKKEPSVLTSVFLVTTIIKLRVSFLNSTKQIEAMGYYVLVEKDAKLMKRCWKCKWNCLDRITKNVIYIFMIFSNRIKENKFPFIVLASFY